MVPHGRISLRRSLLLLVLACLLPALASIAWLLADSLRVKRELLNNQTSLLARQTLATIDSHLAGIESALLVLATSSDLTEGNLAGFYPHAVDALPAGVVNNYILTDRQGRQLLNTLRPLGQRLPEGGSPPELGAVFTERRTVLTPLFTGPVSGQPVVAMGVPVRRGDAVLYSLNVGLTAERINRLLQAESLPPGWLIAVLDHQGTIVARSRDAQTYIGQKAVPALAQAAREVPEGRLHTVTKEGVPVVTAHVSSPRWGWTVAVGAPAADLQAELKWQLMMGLAGMACALGLGLWLALRLVRRMLLSIEQLNQQALAIVEGVPAARPQLLIQEAEGVGLALQRASEVMSDVRFRAEHDPLTGLGNRAYLQANAPRQLSLAQRLGMPVAVLMIDLDGFKAVNDRHGHAAGDELLRAAAQRIRALIRQEDLPARLGGDEFCVVLSNAAIDSGRHTAERLVEALSQPYAGIPTRVSASIGMAVFPSSGSTLEELLDKADRALYRAKARGKACAVLDLEAA